MPIEWAFIGIVISTTALLYNVLKDDQNYREKVNEDTHKAVAAFVTALKETRAYVKTHNTDNSDRIEEMRISSLWNIAADYLIRSEPVLGEEAIEKGELLRQKADHWLVDDPWSNEQLAKTEHLELEKVEAELAELQSAFTNRSRK